MAHGLRQRGIRVLVLGLISLVISPVTLGLLWIGLLWIAIYHGRKGNALAVKHRAFSDDEQFVAVQNAWRNWGLSLCLGVPLCLAFALALVVARYR
jgi:hypothetical protein